MIITLNKTKNSDNSPIETYMASYLQFMYTFKQIVGCALIQKRDIKLNTTVHHLPIPQENYKIQRNPYKKNKKNKKRNIRYQRMHHSDTIYTKIRVPDNQYNLYRPIAIQ